MTTGTPPGGAPGACGASGSGTSGDLRAALLALQEALLPLASRFPPAERALDLLRRDLLPRTAGGDSCLVVGIVGPNNAGKSALFNALAGRDLSPSVPAGGATRRLVGAAHPAIAARLAAAPDLARFRLQPVDAGAGPLAAALEPDADPAAVLLVADAGLPPALLLIDTPDFDSVLADNRIVSESLLTVADLVIAVVTRHSYQNREVAGFLSHWLAHGRPWLLVYNEAIDDAVTRAHAAKLAADIGAAPLGVFAAPHDPRIQRGTVPLDPMALDGPGAIARGRSLRAHLLALNTVTTIKAAAFAAALARLRDDAEAVVDALRASALDAGALLDAIAAHTGAAGSRIAAAAMPAGPLVDAFRAVLDRRSNPLSRTWRGALRRLRLAVETLPAWLRGRRGPEAPPAPGVLAACAREALHREWPVLWEALARDLGPEARHRARRAAPAGITPLLDADLADERRAAALALAEASAAALPEDLADFRHVCETLVERAITERGFDLDIRLLADIATVLPLALAATVIVKTAGLGTDLAAAGGGALSSFLIEKYAHVLGSGIMADARRRWTDLRGGELADALAAAVFPSALPAIRAAAARDAETARQVRDAVAACLRTAAAGERR